MMTDIKGETNHALALSIIEAKNAEIRELTKRAEALLVLNGDLARDNETLEAERDALRKDAARLDAPVDRAAPRLGVHAAVYYSVMHAIEMALKSDNRQEVAGVPRAYRVNDYADIAADAIERGRASALHSLALDAALAVQPTTEGK